jgi:hypothetical protein
MQTIRQQRLLIAEVEKLWEKYPIPLIQKENDPLHCKDLPHLTPNLENRYRKKLTQVARKWFRLRPEKLIILRDHLQEIGRYQW